jgi:hypothetical protein
MTKALKKLRIKSTFLNIIKVIYDKPINNIIPKTEYRIFKPVEIILSRGMR